MEAGNEGFQQIRHFFSNEDWITLSDYEKQVYCNMKMNYDKMTELGKHIQSGTLLHRPRNRGGGSRGACPSNLDLQTLEPGGGAPPSLFFFLSPLCFLLHSKVNTVNQRYFPFLVKSFCYFVSLLQLLMISE